MKKSIKTILILSFIFLLGMNNVYAEVNCSNLTGNDSLMKWIYDIYNIFKYLALVLTVALGMLDFFKAITASDDSAIKKSATTFVKRLIAVVALFLAPILIEFILGVVRIDYCL